jgi:uncharacterized protein YaeQ
MALTATIVKAALQIADLDRSYYRDHAVTLARHPSETDERQHLGYPPVLRGRVGGQGRDLSVRIGPRAQLNHRFRAGDRVLRIPLPTRSRRWRTCTRRAGWWSRALPRRRAAGA